MKRVFLIFAMVAVIFCMTLSCLATDTEAATKVALEVTEEIALEEIVEELEDGSITVQDAILMLAEKAGMTKAEAEQLIESALIWGDSNLSERAWWDKIRASVEENTEFWVMCLLAAVAIASIIGGAVTLFIGVQKRIKRIEYGTGRVMADSDGNREAISQTLGTLKDSYEKMCARLVEIEEEKLKKDEVIISLQEELKGLKSKLEKTNKRMLQAELYNTQAHKLTLERSNLPMSDKSILSLWFAKAEDSLKSEMSESDLAVVTKVMETLKEADGND